MTYQQGQQIEQVLIEIIDELGGDPKEINNGDCTTFAKMVYDKLHSQFDVVIVDNLCEVMSDELEGYPTKGTDADFSGVSHCYLEIEGYFYDAFDVDGVSDEYDLEYHNI